MRDDIRVCSTAYVLCVMFSQCPCGWGGMFCVPGYCGGSGVLLPPFPPPPSLPPAHLTPSHPHTPTQVHIHTLTTPITISHFLQARQTFYPKGPSKSLHYHSFSLILCSQALLEAALHRVSPHSLPSHALVDERYLKTGQVSSLQHHLMTTYTISCPNSVWLM